MDPDEKYIEPEYHHPLFEQEWRSIHQSRWCMDGYFCCECKKPTPWNRSLCVNCAKVKAAKSPRLNALDVLARTNASKRSRRMGKFVPIIPRRFVEQK